MRFIVLLQFEIKKILSQKKAFLFLLALNVVPLLASLIAFLVFLKFKGMGLGDLEFSALLQIIRGLFIAHMKFFFVISPFFLALIIADSISGESGRGYLKTLLLTPVRRWQVLIAKALAVLLFLLIAICLGALFLQMNLWIARAVSQGSNVIMDMGKQVSSTLIDTSTALQLFLIGFVANLAMVGYFILFALFFDSPILMTFVSLIILLAMETYVIMAPYLAKLDAVYGKIAEWCFSRHISRLSEVSTVSDLLENKISIGSAVIMDPLIASTIWAFVFFALALFFFQRKQILN